jgi:hypothetical protein
MRPTPRERQSDAPSRRAAARKVVKLQKKAPNVLKSLDAELK